MLRLYGITTLALVLMLGTTVDAVYPNCTFGSIGFANFKKLPMADCAGYHECVWGTVYDTTCAQGTAWDGSACVHENTAANPCYDSSGTNACSTFDVDTGLVRRPDCSGFDMCEGGQFHNMASAGNCPAGTVFSTGYQVCVWPGSEFDDCAVQAPQPPEVLCQSGSPQHLPHPDQCQLYYDCVDQVDDESFYLFAGLFLGYVRQRYLKECLYPDLFNIGTGECDDFWNVDCGNREEHTFVCDYLRNAGSCPVAHCAHCVELAPNCTGRPDGFNPHSVKTWTPYYVNCTSGRWMEDLECGYDTDGRRMLYHYTENQCVSLDRIPKANNGEMPECGSLADGFYAHDDTMFRECERYYECAGGNYVGYEDCPVGETFNNGAQECMAPMDFCGDCGAEPCS